MPRLSVNQIYRLLPRNVRDNLLVQRRTRPCGAFHGDKICKFDRFFLSPTTTRQKKSRTAGNSKAAQERREFGIVQLPHLHLTEDPQIYYCRPLPAPDIISLPPISCPAICNPGAPTAHLFISWHFFLLFTLSLRFSCSLTLRSNLFPALPPETTRSYIRKSAGYLSKFIIYFFMMFRKKLYRCEYAER